MGVINVTPDSFSDGEQFAGPDDAVAHALRLIDEGAHIIDIGGESTRPGALAVDAEEQIRRVVPVVKGIRHRWSGPISVDTTRATVARAAMDVGANWVNDISALRDDAGMTRCVAESDCVVILMHMLGTPQTMQENPMYGDVVGEVRQFLHERAEFAVASGISGENIILDPGIGFGKTLAHNLALLRRLDEIVDLGYPVLVGASRKSFIGHLASAAVGDRLGGSLAAAIRACDAGAAIVRVHDVSQTRQALAVASAISSP